MATAIMKVASVDIFSNSLSALMSFFIRAMGNMVVPNCLSDRGCRVLAGRLAFLLAAGDQ